MNNYVPTISVIVPVYNVERYLSGCLDSILDQTFTDFEIICVDDGSPDNSIDILNLYADKDSRIKIIRQENQGLSVSRNNAIKVARGKYIFFVDSDDYIAPQTLEFMYRSASESESDIICANFCYTGELHSKIEPSLDYKDIEQKVFYNPLHTYFTERKIIYGMVWNKLYKTNMVKEVPFIPGRLFEDETFTALIMEKCSKLIHMNFNVYYYFANEQAISRRYIDSKMLGDFIKNAEFLCEHFANNSEISVIKKRKVKALLSMCYKKIRLLENRSEQAKLMRELKGYVESMYARGLIKYSDFDIEGKLKLFRLLNLI